MPREARRWIVLSVLVGGFLALRWWLLSPAVPAITLAEPHARPAFTTDFTLPTLTGQPVRLADLRGQPVLINFWATWCLPCRAEMPSMQALHVAYQARGVVIVAIASDAEGSTVVAPFVQQRGLTFPVLLDPTNSVGARLPVQGLPTSYVLDKQGRIVSREVGIRNWNRQEVHWLFEQLLAEPASRDH